jgi:Lrp/AsnC family transcriptional regulator, leucine-responsive regulatory protein
MKLAMPREWPTCGSKHGDAVETKKFRASGLRNARCADGCHRPADRRGAPGRTGLSGPAVADRLRRLEESATLTYRAEVDPRALGYTLFAIVRISPVGGGLRLIPGIAQEVPNVTECYRITGEDCYFMKVYLHSTDDLEPILDLFTPHGRTTTSIVHSAPVPPRPLPVP